MRKIKEDDLENALEKYSKSDLKISIKGSFYSESIFRNTQIQFLKEDKCFNIIDKNNTIKMQLGYIEEILEEDEKLKLNLENDVEVFVQKI